MRDLLQSLRRFVVDAVREAKGIGRDRDGPNALCLHRFLAQRNQNRSPLRIRRLRCDLDLDRYSLGSREEAGRSAPPAVPHSRDTRGRPGQSPLRVINEVGTPGENPSRLASNMRRSAVLQWKARLLASLVTLTLVLAALAGGFEYFFSYLDW